MQKTAYEMRISDWSSYVCSSDLAFAASVRLARMGRLALEARLEEIAALVAVHDAHAGRLADDHQGRRRQILGDVAHHAADAGAADLLVVGERDVQRAAERLRLELRHQGEGGGEEGLNVGGAAAIPIGQGRGGEREGTDGKSRVVADKIKKQN